MQFENDKDKLLDLVNLMNEQSVTPMMVTDDLLYVIDVTLLPEEVEFLLEGFASQRDKRWFPGADGLRGHDQVLFTGHREASGIN